jgi:hypothetical protein
MLPAAQMNMLPLAQLLLLKEVVAVVIFGSVGMEVLPDVL